MRLERNRIIALFVMALALVVTAAPVEAGFKLKSGASRFKTVMSGQAVLDVETGLVWQKAPSATQSLWENAVESCLLSTTGGRMGWRLPAVEEMASLLTPGVAGGLTLPPEHPFVDAGGIYWTVSHSAAASLHNYAVGVDSPLFTVFDAPIGMLSYRAWCVRGGRGSDPFRY